MKEDRETRLALEAAEQAAAAGDYASTERHLRNAVRLQEAELGPIDPDLANTLNNLGVACEFIGKLDDAEDAFRRACAIASASLDPSHPFVATSAENLWNFCEARGRPFESPARPPVAAGDRQPVLTGHEEPVPPAPSVRSSRNSLGAIVVLAAAVLVAIWFIVGRRTPNVATEVARSEPVATPAPGGATAKAAPVAVPPAPSEPPATAATGRATAAPASSVAVVVARVCRNFSTSRSANGDWQCDVVDETVAPGPLAFYTRLRSPRATTVEHRWYRDGTLHQRVELGVAANQGAGYRTYSRTTISSDRAGAWRVELRSSDDVLLHDERFVVR